jgi:hypothetical protein
MSLRHTIAVITKLAASGAIDRYAITGAVAALNYIQPTLTEDLDVLVSVAHFEERRSGLVLLTPIENALAGMGYSERTDLGYMIEGWPVQFLPVASPLDEEALDQASEIAIDQTGTPPLKARCLRPEYIVATAIKVGRLKDLARVQAFLEQNAVDLVSLSGVLQRHELMKEWQAFCMKAGIVNPLRTT